MSQRRRRTFGPLFYSTLVVGILGAAYAEFLRASLRDRQEWEVRSLVAALRGTDPRRRGVAAAALGQEGSRVAVPHLLEAARDPRGEVRALAYRSLIRFWADPRAVVAVALAPGDDQEEVRHQVARAFGRVPANAALAVRSSAGAPGGMAPGLRAQSLKVLRRLLKDRAGTVRAAAADAIGEFGPDPVPSADLVAATGDEDRVVRLAAARALLKVHGIGDRSSTRTLVALVADPEPVPDRLAVLDVLKLTGEEVQDQAVTALVGLLRDGDPSVAPDVIDCLPAFGPPARAALPVLEGLLNDKDSGLRAIAGMAVVRIEGKESPRALAILLRMIADASLPQESRQNALETVREVKPAALAKATPGLIRQLGDASADVRHIALELLSLIIEDTRAELPDPTEGK